MLIEYQHEETLLEGYFTSPDTKKRPAILLAHAWAGRDQFVIDKADYFADQGFCAFALDMYGKNTLGTSKEENAALMTPFVNDRLFLQSRMNAALDTLRARPEIDSENIYVIGFCFGGMCALDLARSGAKVKGAVSVHGLLDPSPHRDTIQAKVLALHGYEDPMVSLDSVIAFAKEMNDAKIDWQMHMFGNTMHAFTNPSANNPDFGTVYSPLADKRTWELITLFIRTAL